jgi:hypothetical protein
MDKKLWQGLGGLLVALNVGALFFPDPAAKAGVQIFSAICGGLFLIRGAGNSAPIPPPSVTPAIPPAPAPAPRPEAEIVAFLALLQEHGRLVDFVREDVAGATDEQLGAAARVVHAGCRKVLDEYFEIRPVRTETEGTRVVLEKGFDAGAHRLLGSVPDQPPYTGILLHPGWAAHAVKLPRITGVTGQRPWPVVAPAEVELS